MAYQAFHGLTAVAELKLRGIPHVPPEQRPFHGLTAVAELKHQPVVYDWALHQPFPRLNRRGRIEATLGKSRLDRSNPAFHGLTAVAELKLIAASMSTARSFVLSTA